MANTASQTDLSVGLGLVFTVVALLGAVGMGAASYLNVLEHDAGLQVLSGIALAVALVAGGLAIVSLHVYHD
jgi:hypothetical protein